MTPEEQKTVVSLVEAKIAEGFNSHAEQVVQKLSNQLFTDQTAKVIADKVAKELAGNAPLLAAQQRHIRQQAIITRLGWFGILVGIAFILSFPAMYFAMKSDKTWAYVVVTESIVVVGVLGGLFVWAKTVVGKDP